MFLYYTVLSVTLKGNFYDMLVSNGRVCVGYMYIACVIHVHVTCLLHVTHVTHVLILVVVGILNKCMENWLLLAEVRVDKSCKCKLP